MDRLTYMRSLKSIRDSVQPARRDEFEIWYGARDKDPAVALILSVYFGWLGVDRFYVGDIALGILKLITLGGFFIWYFVDWLLIMGAARRANVAIANEVKQTVG
jgi:TM2 domain-containing membrane protein YozV